MGRSRRVVGAVVVGLLAGGVLHAAPPAHASVTIRMNEAYGIRTEHSGAVEPYGWHREHETVDGIGVTNVKFGLRLWRLHFENDYWDAFGRCELEPSYSVGTWSITALDGSGDGLRGSLNGGTYHSFTWKVTGGTGRYRFVTDVNPAGTYQQFHDTDRPDVPFVLGTYGPCGETLGLWQGALLFTVQ